MHNAGKMTKTLPPGLSEPIALGPFAAAVHVVFESQDKAELLVASAKIGNKHVLGGGTPVVNLPEGILIPTGERLTLRLQNAGSRDLLVQIAAMVQPSEEVDACT
jgi:hypothetical protein